MSNSTDIATVDRTTIAPPRKWNVVFYNDDKTPMEFVIAILMELYGHTAESAQAITMQVHEQGKAVAGTYYIEIAEQKCTDTLTSARSQGMPLQVEIEKS
jgi:ATP-dependent Clp protease adaptor protein ClpS